MHRVATASSNGKLFPAPRGGWFPTDRFRKRRFNVWQERAGWPRLPDDDPRPFVWKWPPHSLRHHAATWMLNDLGLAPDDVAEFLGHADGHQVWVMYSRIRPGLASRATHLALEAGDARTQEDRRTA